MNISVVLDPRRERSLLPGNIHQYGPNHNVLHARTYRVAMTVIVPAEPSDARADLEYSLAEHDHRPGRPYGLALLESQEHSVMLVTDPPEIQAFRTGETTLRIGAGAVVYAGWPCGPGPWAELIPPTTWHPDGTGLLGEYVGVDGAKVALYEYTLDQGLEASPGGEPTGELANMVSWHCDRCHGPRDLNEQWDNRGPDDRQWVSKHARAHARGSDGTCQPPTGQLERLVSAAAAELRGVKVELLAQAAACAAGEGCARVRQAHAVTARLVATSQP